ncbi:rhodanese-like domain-containing protein [Paraferrimonas sp. SM1919]|uniref:rhodanese-like domain-containing protein n=1 Tax=Paraferrimonas sp. SM1919 TaxID=2662263 RepID=UPI0013D6DB0E|nr:rhodanese-like domain-containing protein [Paraferrimonas sp. SM1919]
MLEFMDFLGRNPVLSIAWVGLFLVLVVSVIKGITSKVQKINHQQAVQLINRQDATIVDVRSNEEFKKGHITGAVSLPVADIKNNQLGKLENKKSAPIIVVCTAGMTSTQCANLLVQQGFESVYNLQGGMTDWLNNNLPVVRKKN